MLDFLLRTGKHGDRYLPWRRGLSLAKLARAPHGIDLGPLEPGVRHRVLHRDRRVALAPPALLAAWDELAAALAAPRPADELVLIGRREVRSNNSWMHNIPSLVSGAERCLLHLHPKDARARGIEDGDTAVLESRVHRGEVRVKLDDDLAPGVVSLPHGWGHAESAPWQRVASARPGVSANDWTDDAEVESVVGQSILNGVPVRLSRRATAA
jgi:anaerobic selenocysteine-containing dehydrogenase